MWDNPNPIAGRKIVDITGISGVRPFVVPTPRPAGFDVGQSFEYMFRHFPAPIPGGYFIQTIFEEFFLNSEKERGESR